MPKVTVSNNVTLNGVMQAPAVTDKDTRSGFSMAAGLFRTMIR